MTQVQYPNLKISEPRVRLVKVDQDTVQVYINNELMSHPGLRQLAIDCRFNVNDLAHRLEMSPRQLHRVFKPVGMSPKKWMKTIQKKMVLTLMKGGFSSKKIAEVCFYSNQKDLCRDFKNWMGMTMSAYRKLPPPSDDEMLYLDLHHDLTPTPA